MMEPLESPRVARTSPLPLVTGAVLAAAGAVLFYELMRGALALSAGFDPDGVSCFLLGGLSWAAFFLPAYFWTAAIVLFMPGFRADILFTLVGSLAPFAVLSALARYLDRPDAWENAWPALQGLGRGWTAASFAALALALMLGVLVIRRRVFGARRTVRPVYAAQPETGAGTSGPIQSAEGAANDAPTAGPDAESGVEQPAGRDKRFKPLWGGPVSGGPAADAPDSVEHEPALEGTLPPAGTEEARRRPAFVSLNTGKPLDGTERAVERDSVPELPELIPVIEEADYLPGRADADIDYSEADAPTEVDDADGPPEPDLTAGVSDSLIAGPPDEEPDGRSADDEPIPVMFGRTQDGLPEDPALSAEFWDDDGAASPARAPLLPSVEVFQDGEHKDALRSGGEKKPSAEARKAAAATGAAVVREVSRRKPAVAYTVPTDGILMQYPDGQYWIIDDKTRKAADTLRDTLKEFNIEAEVTGIRKGPVITMFEILPAPGVRLAKIANLSDNIALRLAASSVRIVAPIPGKHAVGIEVPNEKRAIVSFREIVESDAFKAAKMEVPVVLGKDITGDVQVVELTQTPHLLIAGATGAGKSVCVNSIILSILYRRSFNEVKLLLIDPKIVELKLYNGIPHLLTPVITEPKRAFQALQYCICEMERRYSLLDAMGVRDIRSYNRKITEKKMATDKLPYIVVIIDEFADLMATTGKELESTLARLAAMSRAVGIHLVLATQRPSIDVITGLIKANIPSRIAFMVASKFDSRIIIDMVGAEKLLGRGDMLYSSATDAFPMRMQGAYVSEDEVERVVAHVKTLGEPDYIDEEIFIDEEEDDGPSLFDEDDEDPLFEKALEIVLAQGKASASYLQRKLKIGYNRAARIVELMEEKGIVGKAQGPKPRDVVRNPELGSMRAPNPAARYVPDPDPADDDAD